MAKPERNGPLRVVIPGGSGQVGDLLARHFHERGEDVTVLSRSPKDAPWKVLRWDGETQGDWAGVLDGADVCINLTGRSVNCRYDQRHREEILHSRVRSTQLLGSVVSRLAHPPAVWLNASTATIYRHSLDRPMDEFTGEYGGNEPGAPDTWQFSIRVAKAWEDAFFSADTPRTRKVAMRSAMVMGTGEGGVFDVLSGLARRGLGGSMGSGTQYISWIHEIDFTHTVDFLMREESIAGAVNICAPGAEPNRRFMQALREAWGVRFGLPATEWMIEIGAFLMRTESELVLKSRWVEPGRLQRAGFPFHFPDWPSAACELVSRMRAGR